MSNWALQSATNGVEVMSKCHHGISLDEFLKDERTFEEDQALAIKEVIVWQLTDAMQERGLTKTRWQQC